MTDPPPSWSDELGSVESIDDVVHLLTHPWNYKWLCPLSPVTNQVPLTIIFLNLGPILMPLLCEHRRFH